MKHFEIPVYFRGVDPEPQDGELVVGFIEVIPTPHLLEYNKRKKEFYAGMTPWRPDFWFLLSDFVGADRVQELRERWDVRDDRRPRKLKR